MAKILPATPRHSCFSLKEKPWHIYHALNAHDFDYWAAAETSEGVCPAGLEPVGIPAGPHMPLACSQSGKASAMATCFCTRHGLRRRPYGSSTNRPPALNRTRQHREPPCRNRFAEQSLREGERKLRMTSSSSQDAILMIDHEGKTIFWNLAAEAMFGYSEQEALDTPIRRWHHRNFMKSFMQVSDDFRTPEKVKRSERPCD